MSEEEKKGRSRKQPKEEPQETSLGKEILSWLQIIVAAVVIAFVLNNLLLQTAAFQPAPWKIPLCPTAV